MEEPSRAGRRPGEWREQVLKWALGLGLGFMVTLAACAEPDYHLDSLQSAPPAALPGAAQGVLWQDEPGGPLRFSIDFHLVSNVYREDPKLKGPRQFQVDNQGHKVTLKAGFRNLQPADLGKDAPRYAFVELEINDGKGMRGLNGMLVSRWHRLDKGLVARISTLDKDVDKLAAGLQAKIQPFFAQKLKGRDVHHMEITWLSGEKALLVRQARSVSGRIAPGNSHERRLRGQLWEVPYLTVVYRLKPDGTLLSRQIVEPGDPVASAKRYNPGGSPW